MVANKKAFTLLEILFVVGLLSMLAVYLVTTRHQDNKTITTDKATKQIQALLDAAHNYYTSTGYWPANLKDLVDAQFGSEYEKSMICAPWPKSADWQTLDDQDYSEICGNLAYFTQVAPDPNTCPERSLPYDGAHYPRIPAINYIEADPEGKYDSCFAYYGITLQTRDNRVNRQIQSNFPTATLCPMNVEDGKAVISNDLCIGGATENLGCNYPHDPSKGLPTVAACQASPETMQKYPPRVSAFIPRPIISKSMGRIGLIETSGIVYLTDEESDWTSWDRYASDSNNYGRKIDMPDPPCDETNEDLVPVVFAAPLFYSTLVAAHRSINFSSPPAICYTGSSRSWKYPAGYPYNCDNRTSDAVVPLTNPLTNLPNEYLYMGFQPKNGYTWDDDSHWGDIEPKFNNSLHFFDNDYYQLAWQLHYTQMNIDYLVNFNNDKTHIEDIAPYYVQWAAGGSAAAGGDTDTSGSSAGQIHDGHGGCGIVNREGLISNTCDPSRAVLGTGAISYFTSCMPRELATYHGAPPWYKTLPLSERRYHELLPGERYRKRLCTWLMDDSSDDVGAVIIENNCMGYIDHAAPNPDDDIGPISWTDPGNLFYMEIDPDYQRDSTPEGNNALEKWRTYPKNTVGVKKGSSNYTGPKDHESDTPAGGGTFRPLNW